MDILGDTLYMLNKKYKDLVFRVPLACCIDYKVINVYNYPFLIIVLRDLNA